MKAAKKEFEEFPAAARDIMGAALVVAAQGRKADIAKPLKGLGAGVMEIALPYPQTHIGSFMRFKLGTPFGWFMPSKRSLPKE